MKHQETDCEKRTHARHLKLILILLFAFIIIACTAKEERYYTEWNEQLSIDDHSYCLIETGVPKYESQSEEWEVFPAKFTNGTVKTIREVFMQYSAEKELTREEYDGDHICFQCGEWNIIQLEDWDGQPINTPFNIETSFLTSDTAKDIVISFLQEIELQDFVLSAMEKCRMVSDNGEIHSSGWYCSCLRMYGDLVPMDFSLYIPYGDLKLTQSKQSAPWELEKIVLIVSEEGVQYFSWVHPINKERGKTVYKELISFDKIQTVIRDEIKEGYRNGICSEEDTPHLIELYLTWTMLHHSTHQDAAIIHPVWVVVFTTPFYETYHLRPFIFCVDAFFGKRVEPFAVQ